MAPQNKPKHPNAEQYLALAKFHDKHGDQWKKKLLDMWLDGSDAREEDGHLLRQVRNQFGPAWLAKWRGDVKFDEPEFVVYSPNESASGGAGFWSNEDGWVEFDQATRFTKAERMNFSLPVSAGQDARWVIASEAEKSYGTVRPAGRKANP